MSKINIMDENLANKIAAGEVVEKTMNVVKELVENSIDAHSSSIKIELTDSGVKEIIVTDNGIGMDKEDALLAFSRHATSKIKNLDDLFYISSLGFRGEALPSIASVSNIILNTYNKEEATKVFIEGGIIKEVKTGDLIEGTKITVSNLFYNTPVRLKYLKSLYTELANVTEYVHKMALSFPNIKFMLVNNGKILLNTDGSGNLLKVIASIYGIDCAKKMMEVQKENDDYLIRGYISYPELAKSNRNAITILVNGRVIKNSEIVKTLVEAYHTYIPHDKFPLLVLNIDVDPILVDVNVHPTKMDIKFSKMDSLKELLVKLVEEKLTTHSLIPEIKEKVIEKKEFEEKRSVMMEEQISSDISFLEEQEKERDEVLEQYLSHSPKVVEEVTLDFNVNETEENYSSSRIKKMYPVGLVHGTYIVAENEDGMYLIDQHAAAERINYEKYLKKLGTHDNLKIDMLVPIKVELPVNEYIIFKENKEIMDNLGFTIEEFGINTLLIRSHPYWLPEQSREEAIRKIIDIVVTKEDFDSYKFTEKIAITLACKMSIKANDHITMTDMEDLLERLSKTENPFTCPHGRPTIISYSKYELEKLFKRAMD